MCEHRIYGDRVDIDTSNTCSLYDERAKRMDQMQNPYVSVLLGDQNPEYALAWNKFEKETILPKMRVTDKSHILDLGCGIGRWAESLIPICEYYCGTDMSAEMIRRAKERNQFTGRQYDFIQDTFAHFCKRPQEEMKYKFDRLWICGVMMYVNDAELEEGLQALLEKMDEHAFVYFTETVAIEKRLTLKEFFSSALDADYDVIYRTAEEYNQLYASWISKGFKIIEQGFLPHLNKETQFSETDRWYTILAR